MRITIENIDIYRVVEGKIVEERGVSDSSPWWQRRMEQQRIERERVEQELRVARRIQQASLPEEVPTLGTGTSTPSTSQLGGWEGTSTTSTSSLRVG